MTSDFLTPKEKCPCCEFPTLRSRGGYEICTLCLWEDDGQDIVNADEQRPGPNQPYSLSRARRNFRNHFHMFDDEDKLAVGELSTAERIDLICYVKDVMGGKTAFDTETFASLLEAEHTAITPED